VSEREQHTLESATWVFDPERAYDRAVTTRRECLRLAVAAADWITDGAATADGYTDDIIAVARKFEAYVMGDDTGDDK
jgi:hypothetical protein